MKAHFSIEWLSQSSQAPSSPTAVQSSASWASPEFERHANTAGTVPESLPGFYSRRTDGVDARLAQQEPRCGAVRGFVNPSTQESSGNKAEPQALAPESGFSSGTEEEETSGYESEGGRSLSPVTSKEATVPTSSPGTGRRARTAFTAEQIGSLERAFKRNAYLGAQDKAELCKTLSLSDKQIRNWFQNRRMKLKRTVQDALAHACQANVASQLMHYPELQQSFRSAPYPAYYPTHAHAQESPASYLCPSNLQYAPATTASTLPLYQYRVPVQGLGMTPSNTPSTTTTTTSAIGPYQRYHQHHHHHHQYFSSQ